MADDGVLREQRSIGELALGSLLHEATTMPPARLPAAVAEKAAMVGLQEATIHLADMGEKVLSAFPASGQEPLAVDATDAGRAFREMTVVSSPNGDGPARIWFPLLNGTTQLGVLGGFGDDSDELMMLRCRQLAGLTAELLVAKARYGDEIVEARRRDPLSLSAEIRWALVPPITFLGPEVSVAAWLEPAYDVAGDTFDYAVNGDTAHVAIFDAVGHGVEASRIANLALLCYRHCRRRHLGLVESCAEMDEQVRTAFDHAAYVTAQLAELDTRAGVLEWISAGHPYPMILRRNKPVTVLDAAPTQPLGIGVDAPRVYRVELRPGDTVAFHSDGIPEARSPGGEMFGGDRLRAMLAEGVDSGMSLPSLVRHVMRQVVAFRSRSLDDDATLLLIRWG